jgi:hypothetical protein
MATGLAIRPVQPIAYTNEQVFEMAEQVARSGLFPGIRTPQEAFTLMMLCQAEGTHPMSAIKKYHIIEGRPAMRADYMLAEFQSRGGRVKWIRYDSEEATATFSHPFCPEGVTVSITYADMDRAGIIYGQKGVKTNWSRFPAAMLRARCTSAGIRMVDPGGIAGIYTPEEVADFEPGQAGPDVIEVEATLSKKPALPNNGSGYGSGAYASPEQVQAFESWLKAHNDETVAQWLDTWTGADGTIPPEAETVLKGKPGGDWSASAVCSHLILWAVRNGHLDGTIDPEASKQYRVSRGYAAVLHAKGGEMLDSLNREVKAFREEAFVRAQNQMAKVRPDLFADDIPQTREPGEEG